MAAAAAAQVVVQQGVLAVAVRVVLVQPLVQQAQLTLAAVAVAVVQTLITQAVLAVQVLSSSQSLQQAIQAQLQAHQPLRLMVLTQ
jgi:hypothetical protein